MQAVRRPSPMCSSSTGGTGANLMFTLLPSVDMSFQRGSHRRRNVTGTEGRDGRGRRCLVVEHREWRRNRSCLEDRAQSGQGHPRAIVWLRLAAWDS